MNMLNSIEIWGLSTYSSNASRLGEFLKAQVDFDSEIKLRAGQKVKKVIELDQKPGRAIAYRFS